MSDGLSIQTQSMKASGHAKQVAQQSMRKTEQPPKKLLFYYPDNKRSILIETLLTEIRKLGHHVLCLTLSDRGDLHSELEKLQISTNAYTIPRKPAFFYYYKNALYLAKFCRKNGIDTVWSHLQEANIIAVFAQYLMKSRVVIFRHHFQFVATESDKSMLNRNELLFDKVINRLAREMAVPSMAVYQGMKTSENVDMSKVVVAPNLIDFSRYPKPDESAVESIRKSYPCRLRLIMVSRLINLKRHHIVFPVFKKLVDEGYDIKVMVAGDDGGERSNLERYVAENKLERHIFFLGFRTDLMNFMAAADLLIHPSITEASNSVVKELSLLGKAVAVQRGVGDFDEYIVDGENGFLLSKETAAQEFEALIRKAYEDKDLLVRVGENLRKVVDKFSPNPASLAVYQSLI
jgi:glycosyltransferase involved in cell wall biosynthesis